MLTTSCRKIEMDGEKEVIIINGGGGGGTTGQTITVSGRINADTTFRKANTYILKGLVYMVGNHTLTIEPGTIIKGAFSGTDVAALIITRGSKLMASGTETEPIIFTSSSPNPQSGDWAGIVLCGKAGINASYNGINGLYQVEGGIDNANGDGLAGSGDATAPASVDNDNSGTLKYVRIEYAGYGFQPDKEINSLTMACVGSGTTIDHIEVAYAKDDAYEWFGGTVNCKYLISFKTQDDDFDTDNGFSGKIQFVNPEINPNPRINLVRVAIPNPGKQLKPGMQAYVVLKNRQRNSLTLPIDAVIRSEKMNMVWIEIDKNTFKSVMVETGIESGDKIEIRSGLKEGDVVVTSGAYLLNSEYIFKKGSTPMGGHDMSNMKM